MSYDGNNFLTESMTEKWNATASEWRNLSRRTYTNNASGIPDQILHQSWNAGSSVWVNTALITNSYNVQGLLTETVSKSWDNNNQIWINSLKEELTYDGAGRLILSLIKIWDSHTSSWKNNVLNDFVLNQDGSISESISKIWDNNLQVWENNSSSDYHYACSLPLAVTEIKGSDQSMNLYPVPADNLLTVEFSHSMMVQKITITDVSGRMILEQQLEAAGKALLDISALQSGIYFLQISDDQHRVSQQRFIKK